jgi:hypothetical protein
MSRTRTDKTKHVMCCDSQDSGSVGALQCRYYEKLWVVYKDSELRHARVSKTMSSRKKIIYLLVKRPESFQVLLT